VDTNEWETIRSQDFSTALAMMSGKPVCQKYMDHGFLPLTEKE
jgi:hypothetical protein